MTKLLWSSPSSSVSQRLFMPPEAQSVLDCWPSEISHAPVPGKFPILISDDGEIIDSAFAYLYEVAVLSGGSMSPRTLTTYAESLLDWFRYLEKADRRFDDVDDEDIALYRNNMLGREKRCENPPVSGTTVNIRVRTVVRFYRWLSRRKLLPQYPFSDDIRFSVPENRKFPRLLSRRELSAVINNCAEPYQLMVKWMACTGLRRFQVASLTLDQIANSTTFDPRIDHFPEFEVLRKGGERQRIMAPLGLIDETNWYISTTRETLLSNIPRTARKLVVHGPIFLTCRGTQVSPYQLGRAFRKAAQQAGINATSHHLRHTFAVCMLLLLEREVAKGAILNPLKTLQLLLGHRSITSTEIYLQALDFYSSEVKKSLNYLYGGRP